MRQGVFAGGPLDAESGLGFSLEGGLDLSVAVSFAQAVSDASKAERNAEKRGRVSKSVGERSNSSCRSRYPSRTEGPDSGIQ